MIYAQTETEILNYSRLSYAGSARAAAMGGAFGALGGDISSWNLNPAAVGVFRKSSVTYTSVLNFFSYQCGCFLSDRNGRRGTVRVREG